MEKIKNILYSAKCKTTGGREGETVSSDEKLRVKLSTPKGLGGDDGPGTNPEQLFASGYSACFIGAMKMVASKQNIAISDDMYVEAEVGIGPISNGFGIKADFNIHLPGMDKEAAQNLVNTAHEVCPYSNATRGNIEVSLNIV